MAASGRLVRTPKGPMLIMDNGTSIRALGAQGSGRCSSISSATSISPNEISDAPKVAAREYTERYLNELLFPNPKIPWEVQNAGRLISEGHMRLVDPAFQYRIAHDRDRDSALRQFQPPRLWSAHPRCSGRRP